MLGEGLAAAGAGVPREYLNPLVRDRLDWGRLAFREYWDRVRQEFTSADGTFGVKVHFNHMERLLTAGHDVVGLIGPARWVSLTRLDRVAQAASLHLARRTGRWWGGRSWRPMRYDRDAICRRLAEIDAQEAGWERLYLDHSITPIRITTERLVERPLETMRQVLEGIGVSGEPEVVTGPGRDRRPDRWAERYRAETGQVM